MAYGIIVGSKPQFLFDHLGSFGKLQGASGPAHAFCDIHWIAVWIMEFVTRVFSKKFKRFFFWEVKYYLFAVGLLQLSKLFCKFY